jgi:hypothetical protein
MFDPQSPATSKLVQHAVPSGWAYRLLAVYANVSYYCTMYSCSHCTAVCCSITAIICLWHAHQAIELGQSLLPKDVSGTAWYMAAEEAMRKSVRLGAVAMTVNNVCTVEEEAAIKEQLKVYDNAHTIHITIAITILHITATATSSITILPIATLLLQVPLSLVGTSATSSVSSTTNRCKALLMTPCSLTDAPPLVVPLLL